MAAADRLAQSQCIDNPSAGSLTGPGTGYNRLDLIIVIRMAVRYRRRGK